MFVEVNKSYLGNNKVKYDNGEPQIGFLMHDWISFWKITPWDARNLHQIFLIKKMQHEPSSSENR